MGKNRGVVMNKKIIVITILSIITGLVIFNLTSFKNAKINETTKQVNNTNMLTMMLLLRIIGCILVILPNGR